MTREGGIDDREVEDLRRRLQEAEDTLRAIREGEADAVVVRQSDEDTVFPLGGGDDSYRAIMEAMDIGAVATDAAGNVLYANAAFCGMFGCSTARLLKEGLPTTLGSEIAQIVREAVLQSEAERRQVEFAMTIGGKIHHLLLTAAPLPLAFDAGRALTFTDVTARVEASAAEESERIGQAVIASAIEAVVVCDRAGKVIKANNAAAQITYGDPVGRSFADAFPLSLTHGSGIDSPADLVASAVDGTAVRGLEAAAPFAQPPRDYLVSAAPLRIAGEVISGCVVTLVDLSERKAIEKRQTLLMHELDHRVKNTLTMVLTISSRTFAGARDLEDFRERFTSRVRALAATHNLLADMAWTGIELAPVVRGEADPYVAAAGPRLVVERLDASVSSEVAIAFGLVIHELTTNAVKYGAFSTESGVVTVAGRPLAGDLYEVLWTESGGPPVTQPTRFGFGQTLITRSLSRGGETGASVDFRPEGVVCRIVLPVRLEI